MNEYNNRSESMQLTGPLNRIKLYNTYEHTR